MQRPVVDLPQPLSPTSPRVSPRRMENVTPSTAFTSAILRWKMMPAVTWKYIFSSRMSTKKSPFLAVVYLTVVWASGLIGLGPPLPDIYPAGGVVLLVDQHERGRLFTAAVDVVGAAGIERAAAGHVHHVGRQPLDRDQLVFLGLVQSGHGLEQAQGVGMPRGAVDGAGVSRLHDLTGVHHVHTVRITRHHAQVVGNDDN